MTVILALDTSTPACSVALYINGVMLEDFRMAPRLHNDLISPNGGSNIKPSRADARES